MSVTVSGLEPLRVVTNVGAAVALCAVLSMPAQAQTNGDVLGVPDSIFTTSAHNPISYMTSYDRNVSTGTWTQSLGYSINRPRFSLNTNGDYVIVDQVGVSGQGAGFGAFSGRLDLRAAKNWIVSANGRFNKSASHDPYSASTQRQNRLAISTQYSLTPWPSLGILALLSSEVQQDHTLGLRPPGRGVLNNQVLLNANGDSVGIDTLYVVRDSTRISGRQDEVSGKVDWKPMRWLSFSTDASGNRLRPTTSSFLGGTRPRSTTYENRVQKSTSLPNANYRYQAKMKYTGPQGLLADLSFNRTRSDQAYYDRSALHQELYSVDQRGGTMHLEQAPLRGVVLSVDGVLNRFFGQYRRSTYRNSLILTKTGKADLLYTPSSLSKVGLDFEVDFHRNSRQQIGNGSNVTRFLQLSGSQQLSRKLTLDGAATASLTSFQYVDSTRDEDNARGYLNVGGGYQVSERCNTLVHFSISRGHNVQIDPSQSPNNNVQTTYQMDASMKLRATPRLNVNQGYLLNALYQIYDLPSAESKNVLTRIRRIDTIASDSLFSFAMLQLSHDFLFRDFGSFTRSAPQAQRLYRVSSQTYIQTLAATLNLKPASGVALFLTQSLTNSQVHSTGGTTISNRWYLAVGANVDQTIFGDASLNGTVQHIGAYDERHLPTGALNEQDDWIAAATLVKSF